MSGGPSFAKRIVEQAICVSGIAAAARFRLRGRTLVLAYHNVVPDGEPVHGDSSLHLPQGAFGRQLDVLLRTHDVIPLTEMEETPRRPGRPRAVVTFDDAYRGALTAGVEELARRGVPATVFVAPAFVGGRTFWWDAMTPRDAAGPPAPLRQRGLAELAGRDAAIRQWAAELGMTEVEVPAHERTATEEELVTAVRRGVSLGSHGWSHENLSVLADDELETQLVRPLAWLRERFDAVVPWIAYPYGLCNERVERAAARAGYRGAFRVAGGWLPPVLEPAIYALPRCNVPAGISVNGYRLRISGLRVR